jgi:hypothetical protein
MHTDTRYILNSHTHTHTHTNTHTHTHTQTHKHTHTHTHTGDMKSLLSVCGGLRILESLKQVLSLLLSLLDLLVQKYKY